MKNKKKKILLIIGISLIALIIRCIFLKAKSGDYTMFLGPWNEKIRKLGGLKSLKYNITDYNVFYVFLLTLISYLKCSSLIPIKIISIIFDYLCAFMGYKICFNVTKDEKKSLITYFTILFLPTVIINGALWGQCDSIYSFFCLFAIYLLLEKKYFRSFILLGVAFAFKLQTVLILPIYAVMLFRDKNIKWYYFLIIPCVNFIMCLPAIIAGRNIMDVMMIYFNQTDTYKNLVLNYPNVYTYFNEESSFVIKNSDIITKIGLLFTGFVYFCSWLYILIKKVKFDKEKILAFVLWGLLIAVYFLPRMHERYMFLGDILSVIILIIYMKNTYITFSINLVSVFTYFYFLFRITIVPYNILSFIYLITIILYSIYTFKLLEDNNENKKCSMGRKKLQKV